MLVVLVMVAGLVGTDRLSDQPIPLTPTPTASPTSTTSPTRPTGALPRWIPSVTPLNVTAHPGPYPGPDPGGIVRDVTSLVRGCQGTSRVRLWARAQGKVWLIAAKPPPPGRQHLCWATALMNQGGGGASGTQSSGLKPPRATSFGGGGNRQLGGVSGMVTKRAVRLRVLFTRHPRWTLSQSTPATSSRSTSGPACSSRPARHPPKARCRCRRSTGCSPSTGPATRSRPAKCG
jgi:hypothetical protein